MSRRRGFLLSAAIIVSACSRESTSTSPSTSASGKPSAGSANASVVASGAPSAGSGKPSAATSTSTDAGTDALSMARSIGNTSVVFKLTFESGAKAAWKPRSKRGRDRYKGEVAAYRLARALGISNNVPEATLRKLPMSDLERALAQHAPSLELAKKELVAEPDGNVTGARIAWLSNLEFVRLESEPWRAKWRGWLFGDDAVPEADRATAAQIAAMIVFDGVTGNWDRWSGANVGWNAATQELLFVDNDGAFMAPTPAPFERQRELLRTMKKFPRALVGKLRVIDEAAMRAAVGEEVSGVPLLSDAALRETEARRRAVLEQVDARVRELGEARVFAFQ